MTKIFVFFLMLLTSLGARAQEMSTEPQMADAFRQDGKIYVVIGVIAIIFISIVVLLIYQEKKISRLEKHVEGINTGRN